MKLLPFTFVLFGVISSVYTETCPSYEEIYPCSCIENETGDILVTCSDKLLNLERLKYALNSLSSKENVDLALRDFKIGTLPSNFFYGIGVKILEISHCKLDSLSDDNRVALLGLEYSLQKLSILASFTDDNVPAKLQISRLVNLKELNLSSNIIRELDDDWFSRGPVSLEYLTILNNGIEKIGRNAFAALSNLKRLSLVGNRFGPIERRMLPHAAPKLEALELDNNALTGLPDDIFYSMPVLTDISLRLNGISRLEQRVWYTVWGQLDVIKLEGNPIYCDGHMNWIFELRRTSAIYGTCHSPKEFEGESLQDLIDSRSRYGRHYRMNKNQ